MASDEPKAQLTERGSAWSSERLSGQLTTGWGYSSATSRPRSYWSIASAAWVTASLTASQSPR
jgi:hypothetical protein